MPAIEPAGEKIVRNLQQAVARLHDELTRVELWAGALDGFTKPIPEYGHGQTQFDLPASSSGGTGTKQRSCQRRSSPHRGISNC